MSRQKEHKKSKHKRKKCAQAEITQDNKPSHTTEETDSAQNKTNHAKPKIMGIKKFIKIWKEDSPADRATVWINFSIAIFTFGATIFAGMLFWNQSNTTYKQLRPYMGIVQDPDTLNSNYVPNRTGSIFRMKNFGNTPAYNVFGVTKLRAVDKDSPIPDPRNLLIDTTRRFYFTPGYESQAWVDTTTEYIESVNFREQRLFLYGKIWYSDGFGVDHWTSFIYQYVAKIDQSGYSRYRRIFLQYHQGNDADNNE